MTVIRRMRAADAPEVAELVAEVFGKPEERDGMAALVRAAYESCPFMRPDHCMVGEQGGRIVARWQLLDLPLVVGAAVVRAGGVQGVLAAPGHRGEGLPQAIVAAGIGAAREEGFELYFGFAQRGGFYARLGGAVVMPEYSWRVAAKHVPPLEVDRFRDAQASDAEFMLSHYRRENAARSGAVARSLAYWPWTPRAAPRQLVHPDGYFGYRVNDDSIELREVAGSGVAFHAEVLRKLAALARELGKPDVFGELPPDLPVVALARAFGGGESRSWPRRRGALARPAALAPLLGKLAPVLEARLAASPHADQSLRLTIHWEAEHFELVLGGGRRERKLDWSLPTVQLLALLFGNRPAAVALAEAGIAAEEDELSLASALFPEGHPFTWLTDRF